MHVRELAGVVAGKEVLGTGHLISSVIEAGDCPLESAKLKNGRWGDGREQTLNNRKNGR